MNAERTPKPFTDSARQLQEANQLAEQQRAEVNLRQAEAEQRRNETEHQAGELKRLMEELDARIMGLAPLCKRSHGPTRWTWSLNEAVLRVEPVKPEPQPSAGNPDVLSYSSIRINCRGRGYWEWSHSLWCQEVHPGVFQWWEIGFGPKPFPIPGSSLFALTPDACHQSERGEYWQHVSNPIDASEFIERWMGWFGAAAQGDLQPYP